LSLDSTYLGSWEILIFWLARCWSGQCESKHNDIIVTLKCWSELAGHDCSSDGAHTGMGRGETVGTHLRPVVVDWEIRRLSNEMMIPVYNVENGRGEQGTQLVCATSVRVVNF